MLNETTIIIATFLFSDFSKPLSLLHTTLSYTYLIKKKKKKFDAVTSKTMSLNYLNIFFFHFRQSQIINYFISGKLYT